jgi:hypothetical protein
MVSRYRFKSFIPRYSSYHPVRPVHLHQWFLILSARFFFSSGCFYLSSTSPSSLIETNHTFDVHHTSVTSIRSILLYRLLSSVCSIDSNISSTLLLLSIRCCRFFNSMDNYKRIFQFDRFSSSKSI